MDFSLAYLIYKVLYAQGIKPLNKAEYHRVGIRVWGWKYLWLGFFCVFFFFLTGNYVSQNSPHPPPAEIAVSQKNGKESVTKVKTKRRTLKEEKGKPLFLYCPQQTKSKRKSKRNDEHAESLQMCRTTLCKKHLNKWRLILIWRKKNTKIFLFFS